MKTILVTPLPALVGSFLLGSTLVAGCDGRHADAMARATEVMNESDEGRAAILHILANSEYADSRVRSVFGDSAVNVRTVVTWIQPAVLEALIAYKARQMSWDAEQVRRIREAVNREFGGAEVFVVSMEADSQAGQWKVRIGSKGAVWAVDDRGRKYEYDNDRYSRQLRAENDTSVSGYVYLEKFASSGSTSFSVYVSGVEARHRAWKGYKETDPGTSSVQFDTSSLEILAMIRQGLTDQEILGARSGSAVDLSTALNVLGLVLNIIQLAAVL